MSKIYFKCEYGGLCKVQSKDDWDWGCAGDAAHDNCERYEDGSDFTSSPIRISDYCTHLIYDD